MGEIAKITNGKSNSNDSVKNGAYPFYIRSEEMRRSNKYLYDEEAIITIGEGNIGKVFHYVNGKFDLHQRCYKISNFNSNIYGKFFYYYFSQNFYKRAITDSSKATVDSIRLETITGMAINIPILLKEQIKISTIFDFFNTLITLHQRKLNALENIKKTLLEKMFADEKSAFPSIRFKEFTNAWEQERLGNLCEISTGKLNANAMVECGKYDFYTSGIEKFKINSYAFKGPAITVAGNGASMGYLHLADNFFNAYQRTYVLTKIGINRVFLYYLLFTLLPKKINDEARRGSIPYIVYDMLSDLKIVHPNFKEENKLGHLFDNINSLITLHQRKLNALENIKKTLLEKMFADEKSAFPSIRFKEFTNAWEQEKIGNIFTITRGYVLGKEKLSLEKNAYFKYPVFSSQTGNNGLMGYYNSYLFDKAITWTTDGIYAGDVKYRDEKFYCTNVCGVLLNDNGFINLCNALSINKVSKKHVTKVGNPKLMNNVMKEILFKYSNNLREQKRISSIFNNINTLITLHQRGHNWGRDEKKIRNFIL
ncbi:restriction endonuclease subunit S [Mycoplasma sp. 125]|uniref:restriction endonuclease subunit S n=1 Tax=Mycoplasma sp. 125 TaxID=3447505 RepID=UPI003F65AFD1